MSIFRLGSKGCLVISVLVLVLVLLLREAGQGQGCEPFVNSMSSDSRLTPGWRLSCAVAGSS